MKKQPPKQQTRAFARNLYCLKLNGSYLIHSKSKTPVVIPEYCAAYLQYAEGIELIRYTNDHGQVLNEDGSEVVITCTRPNLRGIITGLE